MLLDRRVLLAGLTASAGLYAIPARALPDAVRLRETLDGLNAIPGYDARLAQLKAFDAASLSPSASLDLRTVRKALAIDSQLIRLVPGGKSEGPYRLPPAPAPGLWRRANGAEAFALLLERHVGDRTDPVSAHRRLERIVVRLSVRADRLMRAAGFSKGNVGDRFKAMFADPRWLYSDDDAGRDAAVGDMNRWLDNARRALPALIGPVPRASLDVSVRRMTRAEEAAGKGGYRQLPSAGQSGAYFVDLKQIRRRPRWSLHSVVHHELLPGHMVQLPIEAAADPHPLRIAYLPAFAEGWAIHAEQLMADHGVYHGAPLEELGHLHWLLFRAVRGLIDTGIHHRRWSVAEARAQLERLQGVPAYFASFEQDLERITSEPAVRAAEALIWLRLADCVWGRGDTSTEINQAVLRNGRKPLRLIPDAGSDT
ncbi:DUF885 family protein [Sphingomonas psychrotolerans]|uniref:DUF885 domain-containing protein n=1 Tax=Sphingomonas psychrotolerans TaxID=1327635 RepID=A0A2K8M9T7_9SPHN|nr:DUF885 family protein [Sphingomonas psychrotolerans]ATY30645.1 DUF885 domain-containing protein [Sphingomonas psychrotolerans]